MISRLSHVALIALASNPLLGIAFADSKQAAKIGDAYYQYCTQEALANEEYCTCISDVYRVNLAETTLSSDEETFMIQALSGQIDYAGLNDSHLPLVESVVLKLSDPILEEGFTACAVLNEEIFIEAPEDYEVSEPTEDQLRAIEELDAIEEMEFEEGI